MRHSPHALGLTRVFAFFVGTLLMAALQAPIVLGLLVGGAAALMVGSRGQWPRWRLRAQQAWLALRLFASQWGSPRRAPASGASARAWTTTSTHDARRFDAGFPVRCEVVTTRVQVWHAHATGRAYEVRVDDGPAGAQPGDEGYLTFEAGRPRVRSQRTLN